MSRAGGIPVLQGGEDVKSRCTSSRSPTPARRSQPYVPLLYPKDIAIERLAAFPYLFLQLWLIGYDLSSTNDDYWTSPGAAMYDSITLESWLQSNSLIWGEESILAVRDWLWIFENFPTALNMSTLNAAVMIYKRLRLTSSEGLYLRGVFRWDGGTGVFVEGILAAIERLGGTVTTSAPVSLITYGSTGVSVNLQNGSVYYATNVIVSTSLPAAARINYSPPLPTSPPYLKLFNGIIPDDAGAVQIVMTWSDKWFFPEGNAILPDPSTEPTCGIFGEMFELTPTNTTSGVLRILIVDVGPNYDCVNNAGGLSAVTSGAQAWLESYYVTPLARAGIYANLVEVDVWDWRSQEPFIPAIVYYYAGNGTLVSYGSAMRQNVDARIYWGGSERAVNGLHWIEGAVQRGNDVACEVLVAMGRVPNCTVYTNWLAYLEILALQWYNSQGFIANYTADLNFINAAACVAIEQAGFSCTEGQFFRTSSLNLFEVPVFTLFQTAQSVLTTLEATLNELAMATGAVYGLVGPFLP